MFVNRMRSFLSGARDETQAAAEDRRQDLRRKVLLKAEVFPILYCAELKIVNASKTGLAGETSATLEVGQPLVFAVEEHHFHQGTVRWVRGRKFGLDLNDALGILGYSGEIETGCELSHQPRARRFPVEISGRIARGTLSYRAVIRDVSRSGLRIEVDTRLDPGREIIIRLRNQPLLLGRVQWQSNGTMGVKTAERMQTLRLAYSGD